MCPTWMCVCAAPLKAFLSLSVCVKTGSTNESAFVLCLLHNFKWGGNFFLSFQALCFYLTTRDPTYPPCTSLTKHSLLIHKLSHISCSVCPVVSFWMVWRELTHSYCLLCRVVPQPSVACWWQQQQQQQQKGRRHVVTASFPGRKRTTVENHFRWRRK